MDNKITKGSEILSLPSARRGSNTELILHEDYCVVGKIVSYNASTGAATFTKVWDEDASKTFNGVIFYSGKTSHPETIAEDSYLPFFRVGEFNSTGTISPEIRTESSSNFSWVGFVDKIVPSVSVSDYYAMMNEPVNSILISSSYWRPYFYDDVLDGTPIHFCTVNMHRESDSVKPGYCVPSRRGYSTWKAKYYTSYDETTKAYSGLDFTQDCFFDYDYWPDDVILPRVGTGAKNKMGLVPFGHHPFDTVTPVNHYIQIVEKSTSDYSSTATRASSIYLYDNSTDLTYLLIPGETVTINTTPVQVMVIDAVYTDHVSFTKALTTSITAGTTFTVDFKDRASWEYLSSYPTRAFHTGGWKTYWPLTFSGTATSGNYVYWYCAYGYYGVCEESDEVIFALGPSLSWPGPVIHGGVIPDSLWEHPTYGNRSMGYTKAITYDYTYQDMYKGGGVKVSRLASDWKVWDETVTPNAWRDGVAGDSFSYAKVYEIWEGKQRDNGGNLYITLI